MNFKQFVWRNTYRNKHLYLAYFLSVLFSITVLFLFLSLLFHPMMHAMAAQADLLQMLPLWLAFGATSLLIIGFVFAFILYSMDIFLQSRKREFGTFIMQGLSQRQLQKMVFLENIAIGFFATIGAIIIGLGLSQLMFAVSRPLLGMDMGNYFPWMAMLVTFAGSMLLFLLIGAKVQRRLPHINLQDLLKAEKMGQGAIKYSVVKGILGIVLLGLSYLMSFGTSGDSAEGALFLSIIIASIGTSLLFFHGTAFIIDRLKRNQKFYWNKTNLVVVSDLAFRMKEGAKAFALVAIISSAAIGAIGFINNISHQESGASLSTPQNFLVDSNMGVDIDDFTARFDAALAERGINAPSASYLVIDRWWLNDDGYERWPYETISVSDYNQLANLMGTEPLTVADGNAIVLQRRVDDDRIPFPTQTTQAGIPLTIQQTLPTLAKPSQVDTLVVSDADFATLLAGANNWVESEERMAPLVYQVRVWNPSGATDEQLLELGDQFIDTPTFWSRQIDARDTVAANAPFVFVGMFLGLIFLFAGSSFLYFRLFSDKQMDVAKFKMINRMGLSRAELRKILSQQIGILFFAPLAVALVNGTIAMVAVNRIVNQWLQPRDIIVVAVFALVYLGYYLVCRSAYSKAIEQEVLG